MDSVNKVNLVIELNSPSCPDGATRAEQMSLLKSRFEETARPVRDLVVAAGGEVLGEAWINSTLKVKVGKESIPDILQLGCVARVEPPRTIELE